MIEKATLMCLRAKTSGYHPGFSTSRVDGLLGDLYSIRGSLEHVANIPGHGLEWKEKSRAIRSEVAKDGDPESARWVVVSDMNIVVSLMAENRPEEALVLSKHLLDQDASNQAHRNTQMANMCICLILLSRYEDAQACCTQAMDTTRKHHGSDKAEMAVSVP